jgi:hypothetical protein
MKQCEIDSNVLKVTDKNLEAAALTVQIISSQRWA